MQSGGANSEDLLAGLTAAQRIAVTSESAPLCLLASAGAGKTRVLTTRIAYRVRTGTADPRHCLAVTFTRKAAGELQDRLRRLGLREQVNAGTFHALASAQLHRWWADRGQQPPALLERKGRLLAPLASSRPVLARVPLADLAGHIEWAQARRIQPEDFEAAAQAAGRPLPPSVPAAAVASLYGRYQDEKVRRGLVDFDDLLARCADAIEGDPGFAQIQRWRWRHVFVDEFQDLNPLQHRLLMAWLGSSTDLCVVGDPHQAVYAWNGADPDLLAQVPERWPTTEVLYLDDNHRCSPQIVAAAAAVLGAAGTHLRSAGEDGPPPNLRVFPSERAEAHGIAAGLRAANARGRRWASMAVLTRTNAQLVPIQQALAAARVPFWSPAQGALLHDPVAGSILSVIRRTPQAPMQAVVADLVAQAEESASTDERSAVLTTLADLARTFQRQEPTEPGQPMADLASDCALRRPPGSSAHRCRHAVQLPPRQGPRMGRGVGRRYGTRAGAHRAGHFGRRRARGAPAPLRSPHARRHRVALLLGPPAHLRDPGRPARRLALAGAGPGQLRGRSDRRSRITGRFTAVARPAARSAPTATRPRPIGTRREGRERPPAGRVARARSGPGQRPPSLAIGDGPSRGCPRLRGAPRRHPGGPGLPATPDDPGAARRARPRPSQGQPLRSDPPVAAVRLGRGRLAGPGSPAGRRRVAGQGSPAGRLVPPQSA